MSVKARQVKVLFEHNVQGTALAILNQIRTLLNDMRPGGNLSNEVIIKDRLEKIHDKLAGALRRETWQQLWFNAGKNGGDWPKFE